MYKEGLRRGKNMKKFYVVFLMVVCGFLLYFINFTVGNPLYSALATSYAKQFVSNQFDEDTYTIEKSGFNFDSKMYDYVVTHKGNDATYAYDLTISSKMANRKVASFKLQDAMIDKKLSEKLQNEAHDHIQNIVKQVFNHVNVDYELYVPKDSYDEETIWVPGFDLDLDGVVYINYNVEKWQKNKYAKKVEELKKAFEENGVTYSRIAMRVTKETEENGIIKMKIVHSDTIYPDRQS